MQLSATLAINEITTALHAASRSVYRMGFGQSPFPVPKHVVKALRAHADQKDDLPVQGLLPLREVVAQFHNRTIGMPCLPDDILIGPGSKQLLFILQLAYEGTLLLPAPSWVSYEPQAHIIKRPVHRINTKADQEWKLTPHALDSACQTVNTSNKVLILNYPSNPVGNTYSSKELKELAAIARKHSLIIVADEIYGEMHHQGNHVSIQKYYPEGTIVSGGMSKWCGAGGWRFGSLAFSNKFKWLQKKMTIIASETHTSVAAPIQHAAIAAYTQSEAMTTYVENSRYILKTVAN